MILFRLDRGRAVELLDKSETTNINGRSCPSTAQSKYIANIHVIGSQATGGLIGSHLVKTTGFSKVELAPFFTRSKYFNIVKIKGAEECYITL